MSVTVESFILAYPEFEALHEQQTTLLAAALERAERRISPTWPAESRDDVVELQLAHMLALSPAGRAAKLSEPGKPTAYGEELCIRKKAHAFARSRAV